MGSRLVRALVDRGHTVRALVLPNDPLRARLDDVKCDIREGRLEDQPSLAGPCAGVRTVFHLAAVILSPDAAIFDRVNRAGTKNLVAAAAAAGVEHFVYVSSASVVYPRLTPYAASKLAAETVVKADAALAHTIVRPTLVYDQNGGQEFQMFADFVNRFPVVPFVGPGTAIKRPVFAGDVVDGLAAIAGNRQAYGRTYNFSGGERISLTELARLILAQQGRSKRFVHMPIGICRTAATLMARALANPPLTHYMIAGMINDADLDPADAVRELGYRPMGVREGFARIRQESVQP